MKHHNWDKEREREREREEAETITACNSINNLS